MITRACAFGFRAFLLGAVASIVIATASTEAAPVTQGSVLDLAAPAATNLPPEAREALAMAQRGDLAGAATLMRAVLEANPDRPAIRDFLARMLIEQGDAEGAVAVLTEPGRMTDQTPGLWATYGIALMALDKGPEARAALEKVIRLEPSNVLARLLLARLDQLGGANAESEARYRAILDQKLVRPDVVSDVHLELAALLGSLRRFDDVIKLLSPLIAVEPRPEDPRQKLALQALATAQSAAGRYGEAEVTIARLEKLGAADAVETRLLRADIAERRGDLAAAEKLLRAVEGDTSEAGKAAAWRASLGRASLHAQRRQWAEAKQAATLAAETAPAAAALDVAHAAVDIYFAADSGRDAVAMVERLSGKAPGDLGLQALLGETQLAVGDGAGAAKTGEAMIKSAATDVRGWLVRGHAAWLGKDAKLAMESFTKATEVAPTAIIAWTTLSDLHHRIEGHFAQHRDSRPVLLRALERNPGNLEIESRLAEMDWEDGRSGEALERHRRILKSAPAFAQSLLALGRAASARVGGLAEAKDLLAKARNADTPPAITAHLEAVIALGERNAAKAKTLLSDIVKQDPGNAVATFDLALAHDASGDSKNAADTANRALQLGLFSDDGVRARALLGRVAGDKSAKVEIALLGGAPIGTAHLSDTSNGLRIKVNLKGLPAGTLGFHVHAVPNCQPSHLEHSSHHAGAHFNGGLGEIAHGPGHVPHAVGDLPPLTVGASGASDAEIVAGRLRVDMIRGRALLIHAGPDGIFGDTQKAMACGIVPSS